MKTIEIICKEPDMRRFRITDIDEETMSVVLFSGPQMLSKWNGKKVFRKTVTEDIDGWRMLVEYGDIVRAV